jgi:hypothetical protein
VHIVEVQLRAALEVEPVVGPTFAFEADALDGHVPGADREDRPHSGTRRELGAAVDSLLRSLPADRQSVIRERIVGLELDLSGYSEVLTGKVDAGLECPRRANRRDDGLCVVFDAVTNRAEPLDVELCTIATPHPTTLGMGAWNRDC